MLRQLRSQKLDAGASVLSSVFLIACIFEIPEHLDLTTSEFGTVIGLVALMASSLRTVLGK